MTRDSPLVSIIIPTYNSAKTLPRLLQSLKAQTYRNIETIVVDAYSSDRTAAIAKKYGAHLYLLRSERAKAKNYGTRVARGEYVLYLDSDMELTPRVVERAVEKAEATGAAGIIIPERSVGGLLARIRDYERMFYSGTAVESARFFRRSLVLEVGGFDEDLVFYEEATLPLKLARKGYNVKERISEYILHHEEDLTLFKHLRKKMYYARSYHLFLARYPEAAEATTSMKARLAVFLGNRGFLRNPPLAAAVLALKALEYMAFKAGTLVAHKER